jgi:hypothetical protein
MINSGRLPWVLYWLAHAAAAWLLALLVAAPLLDRGEQNAARWLQVLALFAHDVVLRRTALLSAAGLIATARIFFRPTEQRRSQFGDARTRAEVGGRHVRSDL